MKHHVPLVRRLIVLLMVMVLPRLTFAATAGWVGAGADQNWSTPANWSGASGAGGALNSGVDAVAFGTPGAVAAGTASIISLTRTSPLPDWTYNKFGHRIAYDAD